ncbi:MAG TPA: 50S ribosomal protein L4 [Chloroflexi bacterium]|nr:50S ribosomal protein L4 [Chloroflexota bacterium]
MKVDVYNMEGQKVREVELPAAIFEAPIRPDLMHQAYVRQMANARLGTHSTKGRGEVSGGGRKPWRQKGTGRARQGSIRSPQWVGGGKVHTPKPRKYTLDMPKKMRRAALRSALSVKAAEANVVVVEDLDFPEPKTRRMAEVLQNLVGEEASALILLPESPKANEQWENVARSANNLPYAKTLVAHYLNIRDLLGYDKVVMPLAALDVIAAFLG